MPGRSITLHFLKTVYSNIPQNKPVIYIARKQFTTKCYIGSTEDIVTRYKEGYTWPFNLFRESVIWYYWPYSKIAKFSGGSLTIRKQWRRRYAGRFIRFRAIEHKLIEQYQCINKTVNIKAAVRNEMENILQVRVVGVRLSIRTLDNHA